MNDSFEILNTPIADLIILQRKQRGDHRGYLERQYCSLDLDPYFLGKTIAQINRSFTKLRGTVRGMHFQLSPYSEIKLISCLRGEIFDVAVDLRADSPTFLQWHGEILSAENRKSMLIPERFAHGFQTLTNDCEMLYLHTAPYAPSHEGGMHPLDPSVSINWPMQITLLSERDQNHPFLPLDFSGIS